MATKVNLGSEIQVKNVCKNKIDESGIIQEIVDKKSSDKIARGIENYITNTPDNSFRLYSLNKARQLLGIGRSTLERYINEGRIGVIPQTKNKFKIPHSELQRFMEESISRKKKQSIFTSTEKKEVTNFINGYKADVDKNFDSSELFDKLMERDNGKRLQ